jgi:shikimate dehydrogenase
MNVYGLIGYPLGHSFSKQYFTDKFLREGITECEYELFPIESIHQFPALISQQPDLKGLNVTIPYKEQVLQFVTHLTAEVKAIGAANCIKIKGSSLTAYNTDIIGFEQSFCKLLQPYHKKALILGTGGSSKAVQYILKKLGIELLVVSRTENLQAGYITYGMINEALMSEYTVIINCSPAGMSPNDHTFPLIPYQFITTQHYLYDLVYKPAKTFFLQKAEAKGALIQNGEEMLTLQAEAAWKIWHSHQ